MDIIKWLVSLFFKRPTVVTKSIGQNINAPNKNIEAFLKVIQYSEGTVNSDDPYRVVFGYEKTLEDLSDHPLITGEWKGAKLAKKMCIDAGYASGVCITTAAGAYQFILPTWKRVKDTLGLPDFSPQSQDRAAIELIRGRGALEDVMKGNFTEAVKKCRKEWASLPDSGYNQPERSIDQLVMVYKINGGTIS